MSLIDGLFPWVLAFLALASAAVGASRVPMSYYRRWWPVIGGGALLITVVVVYVAHHTAGLIADPSDDYPFYINVLAFIAVALAIVAIVGWRPTQRHIRATLLISAVLMVAFAGDQLAIRYGYPRDLRTLLGMEVPGATTFHASDFPTNQTQSADAGSRPGGSGGGPGGGPVGGSGGVNGSFPGDGNGNGSTVASGPQGIAPLPGDPLEKSWHPTTVAAEGELLSEVTIPGTISGFKAHSGYVYLPAAYFSTPRPALPVMVLLAGIPGQPKNFLAGLSTQNVYADLAKQHDGLAPILVFPDYTGGLTDDRGCLDSADGNVETYLTKDVPAFVDTTFGATNGPAYTGIGGFSDGGTCALMIGLRHPDVYGPILALSADMVPSFGGSGGYVAKFLDGDQSKLAEHSPLSLLSNGMPRPHCSIWLEAGDGEPAKQRQTIQMAAAARAANIAVQLTTKPGKHSFDFWRTAISDSAEWVARSLGAIS